MNSHFYKIQHIHCFMGWFDRMFQICCTMKQNLLWSDVSTIIIIILFRLFHCRRHFLLSGIHSKTFLIGFDSIPRQCLDQIHDIHFHLVVCLLDALLGVVAQSLIPISYYHFFLLWTICCTRRLGFAQDRVSNSNHL